MDILIIVIIFTFLGISSFFSACETAITAASKARFHQLAKEGDERAVIIRHFQQNLGYAISVFISCNIMLNAWAVGFAGKLCISLLGERGGEIAATVMGVIIVVYAEVMPKMLAIVHSEKLLLSSARFLRVVFDLFRPFNHAIHWIARKSVGLFGIKTTASQADYQASIEELRGAIDLHTGPNQDVVQEKAMLKSILDLGSVQVEEIMVHRKNVTMLDANDSLDSIVEQVLSSPFTRLPLWKDNPDNIIGIVNAKALLRAVRSNANNENNPLTIESIATKPWFIPESSDLLDQLQAFRARREHFALVVDEYGALLGIVTLEDVLEEIVGDITDEHDIAVSGVRPQADGSYVIDGSVTLRDLNRKLDWDLPDEEASTLGGFILYETRTIPHVGQKFSLHGFTFEIIRRQKNQITMVRIQKNP
ncbi:MAG: CNNM domain-containing protein [Candidatus Paracaedibacteraceae bacterium]|nr:CNNM domain-containing protein [Candidatus Paracaedibacteraceae bacterium]